MIGCANCPARADELHHAIYRQELRRAGGDPDDTQNLVPLCRSCHAAHHSRANPLPSRVLPDSAFAFARGLMGAGAAYEYIRRRYVAGNDPRVAELLTEWEQAA